ncbi:hypothetical protein KC345_g7719 [Hortaea werneckii]|nr:hypothetical protein KC345_g7719 [Hortaea werneckii]
MEAFDVFCAHQQGLPLPIPPRATSDRGHTPEQQSGGEAGRGEGEEHGGEEGEGGKDGEGAEQENCGACTHPLIERLGKENVRLRKQMNKDSAYIEQLVGFGLEFTNKLLEERAARAQERADHAREVAALKEAHLDERAEHAQEVAALKEAHLAEMKEAYCRMPAQVVPKRAGEGMSPPTSPEKRVCLSEDASQQEVRDRGHTGSDTTPPTARLGVWFDDGDAPPTIKSLDEIAPELRPEVESWVETWRSNATTQFKDKSLDDVLPSKNCVAQRSRSARSDQFLVDGKPVIYISCVKCTGHHRMCCRRDPSFPQQNLPYDFVLSPLAPELRGNTRPCDRGHYVFEQDLSTAMRKKYGKAAATGGPSPSESSGNVGFGTRSSAGNVAPT